MEMINDEVYLKLLKKQVENVCCIEDITIRSRKRHFVDARKMFCHIARRKTKLTYGVIGDMVKIDHATVIHSIKKADLHLEMDVNFLNAYNEIESKMPQVRNISFSQIDGVYELKNQISKLTTELTKKDYEIEILKDKLNKVLFNNDKKIYTNNEIRYRLLNDENKTTYNTRVDAILKMLEIKDTKETDKYELINCEV
tara:strand:+ start:280 stop:873 length:594 start_codon:yes stop_codon:yes gene_type:complete